MKKNYLYFSFIFLIFFGCNTKQKKSLSALPIDTSITKSNSYNDLFLDSNILNKFYSDNTIAEDDINDENNFYYSRNFEYAWFSSAGLTEQARSLWNLLTYTKSITKDSTLYNSQLRKIMTSLIANDSLVVDQKDSQIVKTELLLTKYFINFLQKTIDKSRMNAAFYSVYIPSKKIPLMDLCKTTLEMNKNHSTDITSQKAYYSLSSQLNKYYNIAQKNGWQNIPFN